MLDFYNKRRTDEGELTEYRILISDEEKASFWVRIRTADAQPTEEDCFLINEVIQDNLHVAIIKTKDLLGRVSSLYTASQLYCI